MELQKMEDSATGEKGHHTPAEVAAATMAAAEVHVIKLMEVVAVAHHSYPDTKGAMQYQLTRLLIT